MNKRYLTIIVLLLAGLLMASPVKSNISARETFVEKPQQGLSAKDYIQDGLVAMLDGIENAGWGQHDPNATEWKFLVNTLFKSPTQTGDFTFTDDAAVFDGTVKINTNYSWNLPSVTVETVFDITSLPNYLPIIDCTGSGGWTIKREKGTTPFFAARNSSSNSYKFIYLSWSIGNVYAYSFQASSSGIIGYDKGVKISENEFSSINPQQTYYRLNIGATLHGKYPMTGKIRNLRIYSRALTADEIAYNYAVDKERFGLP